jgi:hypothetical protein
MKIKDHIGGPAAVEAIEAFEKRHDIKLPDDYRTFLASQNGGRPEMASRVFTFQKEGGSISDSLVDWFSGLIESEDYSLEEDFNVYKNRIPKGMLPIACDPFGNRILLGVRTPSGSGIWFWDHEIEPTSVRESGIYKIADNFEQFIESLSPVPET